MTKIPGLFTSPKKENMNYGRVALCTLQKASFTVEASVVLPVFLLALMMLISLIDICRVKVEAQAQLTQQAKELSMYAYVSPGIYGDGYVDLYKIETYDFPVKLFPFPEIKLAIRARIHTWTGRRSEEKETGVLESGERVEMVYVTDRETVYHTNEACTHLTLSILQAEYDSLKELRNKYGSKYHPCEKCCGTIEGNVQHGSSTDQDDLAGQERTEFYSGSYYVTEQGDTYHTSLNCGSLKRTTKMVKKAETWHLEECQRCQALNHGEY